MKPAIYVCSKIEHIPMWKRLRSQGLPIISRWIDLTIDQSDWPVLGEKWDDIVMPDIASTTHLLVFAKQAERLKGGIAEVSAVLFNKCPIYVATDMMIHDFIKMAGIWPTNELVEVHTASTAESALDEIVRQLDSQLKLGLTL